MKIKNKTFTIGADPEIFVGDVNSNFVCAAGMVPGTKEEPFKVNKGAVQVDGMALEFNIDPAENYEQFQNNLDEVRNQLEGMIGDHKFIRDCSVTFDQKFLENVPFESLIIGCDPDYNAYSLEENMKPDAEDLMRTVGGHVHIGGIFEEGMSWIDQFYRSAIITRLLDKTLGVYSVLWDHDDKRRTMYGQAGSFRVKPYGMEYRTLSNSWIFDKNLVKFVYDSVEEALGLFLNGEHEVEDVYREVINESDRDHYIFYNNKKADLVKAMV